MIDLTNHDEYEQFIEWCNMNDNVIDSMDNNGVHTMYENIVDMYEQMTIEQLLVEYNHPLNKHNIVDNTNVIENIMFDKHGYTTL